MSEILCIVCPLGCRLGVGLAEADGEPDVTGASCARGREYALQEATAPKRVLTTTVATAWGRPLPVRSASPIDKEKLLAVQRRLCGITIEQAVVPGQVVVSGIDGQGTALVATAAGGPRRT